MNILELCLTRGLGGLEVYVFRISQALSSKHPVTAIVNGKLLRHFNDHSSIETHDFERVIKSFPLLSAYKLARFIDHHKIDIIHAHWTKDLPLAALAKKFSKTKPALIFTRQMDITKSKNDFYHRMQYSQIDLFLAITEKLNQSCRRFITRGFKGKIKTLYHGVPEPGHALSNDEIIQKRSSLGLTGSDFVIGLFGRLEHGKGQHLLIEALAQAKNDNIELKALIVGHEMKPGYLETLKRLATELDVSEQIIFHDFVKEPQTYMQLCNCVALTTYNETFGLVLPEAMRAGVAVIGSNRGGVPEIIDHESTGLLFEAGDSSDLLKQIKCYYSNDDFRQKMAENGKRKADQVFNDEKHYSMLESMMNDALASRHENNNE